MGLGLWGRDYGIVVLWDVPPADAKGLSNPGEVEEWDYGVGITGLGLGLWGWDWDYGIGIGIIGSGLWDWDRDYGIRIGIMGLGLWDWDCGIGIGIMGS